MLACLFVASLLPMYDIILCNKMNILALAIFAPNSKGIQLRDLAKKLSLTSYRLFLIFTIAKAATFHSRYRKLGLNSLRMLLVIMSITIYGYRIVHRL